MQYLVAGIFKPHSDEQLLALGSAFSDHIGQASERISLFGLLRDKQGNRRGYLAFIEARDFDDADAYLRQSPFYENDLYERVEVAEFTPEVGSLG